jgi:small-conductance mechanosensitive channel
VEFVGAGILASLAVVLVIGSVVAWICEQLPSQPRVTSVSPVGPSTAADVAQPPPSGSYEDSIVVSGDQAPRLIGLLVRAVGVAIALLLLLRIWGIQADLDAVDWKTVGLGVLVVVVAIVVDRIVVTALFTLHMSDRLPESTANIIRRWSRGVLTLIAVLVLLALGGYQVTNVWTLLTGVAAMVAVGFVAVWSVLSNIMSTFIILFWKPFNVGEHVEILPEGVAGDVIDINFMYTLLQTEAGERTTVPNSLFLQKFIKRKSMRRRPRRSLAEQLAAPEPVSETNT